MTQPAPRHLTLERLHEYLRSDGRAVVPIAGDPTVTLTIDGARSTVAIETPWDGIAVPALDAFEHLTCEVLFHGSTNWARLEVQGAVLLDDAYPWLVALADRIQLEGQPFGSAVLEVLDGFRALLAKFEQLTREREVGLFGELLVLERLHERLGLSQALEAWLGPAASEHDFALPGGDVEVKTTVSERRLHRIHGLGQLQAAPGRDLYLLSLQLTAAGAGPGRSLGDLIRDMRAAFASHVAPLDQELARFGWRDEMANHRLTRFRLRSPAFCVHVDELPAITATSLSSMGIDLGRIDQVSYELDVTGLPEALISTDDFAPEGG